MTTPIVFDVQGAEIRFGQTEGGAPYSVATDFAKAMGYLQASDATRLLDEDEKGQQIVLTPGGPQQLNVIYEDGMWELIFRSSLPGAKAIKVQVKAILRQIRETGSYSVAPAALTNRDLARMVLEEADRADAAEHKVAELEPMAAQAAHYRSADGLIAVGDFANDIKGYAKRELGLRVLHPQVWEFLGEIGLLIRGNTVRHNEPTAFATEKDYVRAKKTEFETNTRGLQSSSSPRLTPAGAGYAWDRAVRRLMEHQGLRKDDGRGQLDIIQGGAA
jgi:anti-repressor protein